MTVSVGADIVRHWPLSLRDGVAETLLDHWDRPGYHGRGHLLATLEAIDELQHGGERLSWRDSAMAKLGAFFHDAVYDGEPGRDERRSAALARDLLGAYTPLLPQEVDRVCGLVMATADHGPHVGDEAARVLCDADLSVLGGSPWEYAAYMGAVRLDYPSVPDRGFAAARRPILRRILDDGVYRTPTARRLWGAAAERNLLAELAWTERLAR